MLDRTLSERVGLVDAIDHLLNRGVVLAGQTTLSLAGVDLVYLGLNVLITSVQTLNERRWDGPGAGAPAEPGPRPGSGPESSGTADTLRNREDVTYSGLRAPSAAVGPGGEPPAVVPLAGLPERIAGDTAEGERGLARLVLTLIELLRQVVERQAVRRLEGEGLAEEVIERMGLALMQLEAKMLELRELFGLSEAELNLDLGPLGRLLGDAR